MIPDAEAGRGLAALTLGRSLTCASCRTPLHGEPTCPACGDPFRTQPSGEPIPGLVDEMRERLAKAVEGRYELRGLLGHGGMGAVFLAAELKLDRLVAIKVLPPTLARDDELLSRFEREARTAARLDHAGIVPIYSVEEVDGLHFFVMKFVPGADLDEVLERGPIPVDATRRILVDTARALAHAHARGVIHRDVKPSNIMIDQDGRVVVADFGIAKAVAAGSSMTSTGQTLGSPQYMSPEQMEARDVDGRSDQYGLGMVAWHMLAGRAPFEGSTFGAVMVKQVTEYPASLKALKPDLPDDLVAAVERAIRKDPDERFADMGAFAEALSGSAPATAARSAGGRPPARSRRPLALGAGALVVALAGWMAWSAATPDAESGEGTGPASDRDAAAAGADVETRTGGGVSVGVTEDPSGEPGGAPTSAPSDDVEGEGAAPGEATPSATPPATPPPSSQGTSAGSPPVGAGAGAPTPPAPAQPEVGHLTLNATPFAYVCIDGVDIGQSTPIFDLELAPGPHVVVLYRAGHRTITDTLDISARNPTRRAYTMLEGESGPGGC